MYGFICKDENYEWWVRRKEKGRSEIIISRESDDWITHYDLSYVTSMYCDCPKEVKSVAKELIS
ncbi:hypothetical protein PQ478_09020 [Alkalihalophilus pseudofirmus]|uniref:hypothetical protein n=1 Tax=Alkalihalophilus pseudofirmus TaxID=79885 RepID=UPI00259AF878|nr:hypothetical protein [Alkalihalophilus pseudofirmus]WEG18612.1 hypothetical protein PQ478_09020 [Alkalihalophilus pseudofirmus]